MQKKPLISYQEAIDIIHQVAIKHAIKHNEPCLLADTVERVLAQDIHSPISVPNFNNSAMDGFAVKSNIVNESIKNNGSIRLEIEGSIQAGDPSATTVQSNHLAWEIMTGAPVPDHFDAVIQIENVVITDNGKKKFIEISETVKKGRNVRMLGTDYQVNQLVASKQTTLQAQHIMALATVGIVSVDVIPKIKVAILSTGNELFKVSSGILKSGTIFNSNQPFLKSFSKQLNCDPVFTGSCKDDIEAFNQLIDDALLKKVKIIFSTGAVSMGKYDFIPQALAQRGAKIHFHKSKIRPGKPILFAELPDGTIYFGLPGNPIAAASGMRFFVAPFITQMLGLKPETKFTAKLTNDIKAKHGFRTFAKAYASIDTTGQLQVEMLRDQGSYQSRSFAHSNCWLIIPENKGQTAAGELIEIASMVPNQIIF